MEVSRSLDMLFRNPKAHAVASVSIRLWTASLPPCRIPNLLFSDGYDRSSSTCSSIADLPLHYRRHMPVLPPKKLYDPWLFYTKNLVLVFLLFVPVSVYTEGQTARHRRRNIANNQTEVKPYADV
jgi:hypothetical protein